MVLGLSLFWLAFLPRVFGLSQFLTPDENLWISRGIGFLKAISQGDWAGTFQVGHPGVTTRWTAVIGILVRYLPAISWKEQQLWLGPWSLSALPDHLMEVLAATRFPTVLLFSCLVVAVYFLIRRLLGPETALLGAVLLALDPFCLAISRVIHHDALNAIFMTTSLLVFALWLDDSRRKWLVLSGVLAALGVLSKSTALFLGPAICLTTLIYYVGQRSSMPWKRLLTSLVLWGVIAAIVFTALWPAMWVDPFGTVKGVIEKAMGYAASPHERDNFFMGQLRPDPGPLFYPIATMFRLTPLSLIGVVLSLFAVWRGLRQRDDQGKRSKMLWLVVFWAFVITFTGFMTLGAKKFDRYLLPIYPFLNILAAAGLIEAVSWVLRWIRMWLTDTKPVLSGRVLGATVALVLVLQGWSSLPAYPYYLTAYNPLLGGIQVAAHMLLIGWGEGYDQVADYLNAKPGAEKLNVATWYAKQTLNYLFKGHSWDIRVNRQEPIGVFPWTQADYVVLYINQLQRKIPDERTLTFFQSLAPEHVVKLAGLDYAWVYRVPASVPEAVSPYQHPVNRDFGGKVRLLGYDVDDGLTESEGNQYLVVTFYWQCLQPMADNYRLYLKLINGVYHNWGEQESYPIWDGFMTSEWNPGTIIRDVHGIVVKPGTPPGSYQVTVDWLEPYKKQPLLPDGDLFVAGPVEVPALPPPLVQALDMKYTVGADFDGKVRLLGYNMEGRYRPGGNIHLTVFWQALRTMDQSYTVFNHLIGPDGTLRGQKDSEPVDGFYPTTRWAKGEIIRDQYDLSIAPEAPAGPYHIETGIYSSTTGGRLPLSGSSGDKVKLNEINLQF